VINRGKFLHLLDSALACKAFRFGRQASLSWLAIYPGDLEVMLLQAEMLAGDEKRAQSIALLDKLGEIDPEYVQAYELQARVAYNKDEDRFIAAISAMKVLGTVIPAGFKTLAWADELVMVRRCMEQGELDQAQDMLNQVLGREERSALCLLDHLRLVSKQNDAQALFQLAELYQAQYPNNLPVLLMMINALMELGNEPEAVKLLHQCVSMDSAGQVARRMWGKDHTYQSIWPEEMAVLFDIPIPAEVAVRLSGAWLPVG
jgi:predicted Zn-dependent protease